MNGRNGNGSMESHAPRVRLEEVDVSLMDTGDGLLGFGRCLLVAGEFKLFLGNIALRRKLNGGVKLVFPAKFLHGQEFFNFHPINRVTHHLIQSALERRFKELSTKDADYRPQDAEKAVAGLR